MYFLIGSRHYCSFCHHRHRNYHQHLRSQKVLVFLPEVTFSELEWHAVIDGQEKYSSVGHLKEQIARELGGHF